MAKEICKGDLFSIICKGTLQFIVHWLGQQITFAINNALNKAAEVNYM